MNPRRPSLHILALIQVAAALLAGCTLGPQPIPDQPPGWGPQPSEEPPGAGPPGSITDTPEPGVVPLDIMVITWPYGYRAKRCEEAKFALEVLSWDRAYRQIKQNLRGRPDMNRKIFQIHWFGELVGTQDTGGERTGPQASAGFKIHLRQAGKFPVRFTVSVLMYNRDLSERELVAKGQVFLDQPLEIVLCDYETSLNYQGTYTVSSGDVTFVETESLAMVEARITAEEGSDRYAGSGDLAGLESLTFGGGGITCGLDAPQGGSSSAELTGTLNEDGTLTLNMEFQPYVVSPGSAVTCNVPYVPPVPTGSGTADLSVLGIPTELTFPPEGGTQTFPVALGLWRPIDATPSGQGAVRITVVPVKDETGAAAHLLNAQIAQAWQRWWLMPFVGLGG